MNTASENRPWAAAALREGPYFVFHPSFEGPDAEREYGGPSAAVGPWPDFMPDDATRDCTRRMHYAAWRAAAGKRDAGRWRRRYHDCRDRIVLGNRKLTFRAVQKWGPAPQLAEDMVAECQLVLINAVAAFNPWLGVRFSTYAFTCLMRALSRLSQRHAADRLSRSLPLTALPGREPYYTAPEESGTPGLARLDEYLQAGHTLLTPREKIVLIQRYRLNDDLPGAETLEQVGRRLGLSKERVRQLQSTALGKLRAALLTETPGS